MKTLICVILLLGLPSILARTQEEQKSSGDTLAPQIDEFLAANDKYFKNRRKGVWGGDYRCPSGKVYEVADNRDGCKSLAGTGGEMLNCHRKKGKWTRMEVDCASTDIDYDLAKHDKYHTNWFKGRWGGEYRCPSGKIYNVAAKKDDCKSLSGKGG